jgi:hypothetical protein
MEIPGDTPPAIVMRDARASKRKLEAAASSDE